MKGIYIIILTLLLCTACSSTNTKNLAMCLSDKNIAMYGTNSCPNCLQQKYLFGEDFIYVPYIDCEETPQRCKEEKIGKYPTWRKPNGEQRIGRTELDELAEWADCQTV